MAMPGTFGRQDVCGPTGRNAVRCTGRLADVRLAVVGEIASVPRAETCLKLLAGPGILGRIMRLRTRQARAAVAFDRTA